ncbi:hypothetical protein LINPERHAP2_LOCUS6618 [Linum perenne]
MENTFKFKFTLQFKIIFPVNSCNRHSRSQVYSSYSGGRDQCRVVPPRRRIVISPECGLDLRFPMAATEKNRNPSLEGASALLSCFVDLWLHSIVHTHVPTFVTHGHQLDIGDMFLCLMDHT